MTMEMLEFSIESSRLVGTPAMPFRLAALPTISGHIIHGNKLGRELGIPTANIAVNGPTALPYGIYAVRARLDEQELTGVASWGTRPHFDDGKPLLEVHLFDFKGDIYGRLMTVDFVSFLRDEARFDSITAFLDQIRDDIAQARHILMQQGMCRAG